MRKAPRIISSKLGLSLGFCYLCSVNGFLIILLILFFFFGVLPRLLRSVLRWKINRIQKEMAHKGGQSRSRGTWQRSPREGEVRVDAGSAPGGKINRNIGDYVEYEEIEVVDDEKMQP